MYGFLICRAIKQIKALLYVMFSIKKAIKAIKALLYVCLLYAAYNKHTYINAFVAFIANKNKKPYIK